MIDVLFAIIAATVNAVDDADHQTAAVSGVAAPSSVIVGQGVTIGENTTLEGVQAGRDAGQQASEIPAPDPLPMPTPEPAGAILNMSVVPAGLVADPQTPTGKFTTAAEVKAIMNATKGNWVAVREYDGSDLLYVTHIWSWRCGLAAMAISINDEPMQNWPLPGCHMQYATPNAILEEDGLPYLKLRLGSVQNITIQIIYDDLTGDVASFQRGNVLIP